MIGMRRMFASWMLDFVLNVVDQYGSVDADETTRFGGRSSRFQCNFVVTDGLEPNLYSLLSDTMVPEALMVTSPATTIVRTLQNFMSGAGERV